MQKIHAIADPRRAAAAELRQRLRTMINRQYGKHGRHQLFMHAVPHTDGVTRRGNILAKNFNVTPYDRPLVVVACSGHDVIQRWHLARVGGAVVRRRAFGVSEDETNVLVAVLMRQTGVFDDRDITVVTDAIAHTKVLLHPEWGSVYQPLLSPDSSVVARIVAFSDLGSAGMDGWKAFSREGRLLFHEMYPRVHDHAHELRVAFLEVQQRFLVARERLFWSDAEGFPATLVHGFAAEYLRNVATCQQKLAAVNKAGDENPLELEKWFNRVLSVAGSKCSGTLAHV